MVNTDDAPDKTEEFSESLLSALRRAKEPQWTDRAIVDATVNPTEFRAGSTVCANCPAPCQVDEVCLTAIAADLDLHDHVGRDQAYHLLENGLTRLIARQTHEKRTLDRSRPNTFVRVPDNSSSPKDGSNSSQK